MSGFPHIYHHIMTFSRTNNNILTQEEFDELVSLKNAIHDNPASVHPDKLEKFTELFVRSLEGKCDPPPPKNWRGSSLSE